MFYTARNVGKSIVIDMLATASLGTRILEMDILEVEQKRNKISVAKKPKTKAERKAMRRKQEQINQRNKLMGKY